MKPPHRRAVGVLRRNVGEGSASAEGFVRRIPIPIALAHIGTAASPRRKRRGISLDAVEMKIAGYLRTSLIEWPGKISAVIFVSGCNFRCPFCYNRDLVDPKHLQGGRMDSLEVEEEEIFKDLKKRKKWIDGAVLTGGEPLLQSDLSRFLSRCKQMGFETMIETNGSKPEVLRLPIADSQLLIDFVAMDFKAPLDERYAKTVGLKNFNSTAIVKSIKLLLESEIPFELRTTVVPGIHDRKVLIEMAKQLKEIVSSIKYQVSSIRWFLQQFQPKNCLDPSFEKIKPYSKMEMERFLRAVEKIIPKVELRGL